MFLADEHPLAVRWRTGSGRSWFMPLTRGKPVGYDANLMAFKFTMWNTANFAMPN